MTQQIRKRKQQTVAYSSGNKTSERLSRGMVYRDIYLRLKGQLAVTAAANTAAATKRGDEWGVIKRIDLIANNTEVLKSIDGAALFWLNLMLYTTPPRITPAIGDAATLNPAFDNLLVLPLWMPQSLRPVDTALDARELSDLKIEITWGSHLDINASATGFTVNPTLEVYSLESFNVQGPFSQWRVFPIEREITANNPRFQIQLPVGPMYRAFLINTTNDDSDVGTVLNNFRFLSGTTVYADWPENVLDQVIHQTRGIFRGFSGTAYDAYRRGSANNPDGWYYYDHVTDGFNSEAVDSLGFSELELELDVTKAAGVTKIRVYPQQIIPVRGG